MTNAAKNILLLLISLALTLLCIEGVLHLFPVNQGLDTQPVNDASPIIHFRPNRTFTWSRFADFSMRNRVHTNNLGFINDQDYSPDAALPLVAVIGDSYVEAAMVPWGETLQGRLAKALLGERRVYSFGVSGAPLSQYLAFADYARRTFHPAKMVIVVVTNDFDESLLRYKRDPGFHYFDQKDGELILRRVDYAPSPLLGLLRHSRLCMYLLTNVQLQGRIRQLLASSPTEAAVGQTSASVSEERLTLSREAVDAFFRLLPEASGLPANDVVLVVDAIRPHLYTAEGRAEAKGSYADLMRTYFLLQARQQGYRAVDMTGPFLRDYAARGQRFEFPRDAHWNGHGHAVAAESVLPLLR